MNDKRWAYQVIEIKPAFLMVKAADIQEKLNQMGQNGWELVNAVQSTCITLYFKRPL